MAVENTQAKKKYNLLLVNPYLKYKHIAAQVMTARLMGKKAVNSSLALPIIAALTPDNYNIRIADEEFEQIPKGFKPDIVGITCVNSQTIRAYEIASFYRKKGAKVIIGGPYATYNYEEVLEYVDTVVIDEAEGVWGTLLQDFEKGELKRTYKSEKKVPFKTNVFPRWDLVKHKHQVALTVQATRGCPYKCEFCLVSEMFGRVVRYRDTDNVIEEIKRLPIKRFLFADDNITINREYALELFTKMKGLNVFFNCQSSFEVAYDEELLKAMAEAGCNYIVLGFESLNQETLQAINKFQNKTDKYIEAIKKINQAGIQVYASFIIGFDHDTLDEFNKIANFLKDASLPIAMISALGASKGTVLFDRLVKEGRWYGPKRELIVGLFPVMHYNNFSQLDFLEHYFNAWDKLYDYKEVYNRSIPLYEQGYFTKEMSTKDVSFFFKLRMTFKMIGIFMLSTNPDKRKLFFRIFSLIRYKKLSGSTGIMFLMVVEGIRNHIKYYRGEYDYVRSEIAKVDKGPWKHMQKQTAN